MQLSFELLSFILSIVSLIVSGGAVWLSFKFYQMSDNASKEAKKSSDQIQSNTEKLEGLFSRLYSDTFTIMKDTVSDMRQHIYHNPEKNNLSFEDKLNSMKDSMTKDFKTLLEERYQELDENGNKIKELESEIEKIVEKQITTAISDDEKDNEIIKLRILEILKFNRELSAQKIIDIMKSKYGYTENNNLHVYLFELRNENKIMWNGTNNKLNFDDIIIAI